MRSRTLPTLCLALACAGPASAAEPAVATVTDQAVQVQRQGGSYTIDLVMHAPVPLAVAWAVLTDFDHMAEFIPNLSHSQVLQRADNVLRISQKGQARWGPFSMDFESVREVTLLPQREIRSRGLAGTVKRVDSTMTLVPDGEGTRLHYHNEVEPGTWLPPVLGPARVREETAAQFNAILQEMARRR
jgi:carbon monoxide dehydrogenase subunit G